MDIIIEIRESLFNLFNSNISSDIISDISDISIDEIKAIRNNISRIEELPLNKAFRLYNLAIKNKINKSFIDNQNKKGSCSQIKLDIPIKKLYVSQYDYGLFTLGMLEKMNRNYKLKDSIDNPERLLLARNIFLNKNDEVVYKTNDKFLCGYTGSTPKEFVSFISEYSKLEKSEIEEIIFNNSIVSYDFYDDKLEGYKNILLEIKDNNEEEFLNLYEYNGKLIINLLDKGLGEWNNISLDEYIEKIYIVLNILKNQYKKDITFRQIKYIKKLSSDETKIYKLNKSLFDKNIPDLVLEFDEFEIWLKTGLYSNDIFRDKDMIKFLEKLDLKVNKEKNFIKSLLRKVSRILTEDEIFEILKL